MLGICLICEHVYVSHEVNLLSDINKMKHVHTLFSNKVGCLQNLLKYLIVKLYMTFKQYRHKMSLFENGTQR